MLEVLFCSALQKIFSDTSAPPAAQAELRLFSGESGAVQLFLRSDTAAAVSVSVETALPHTVYEVKEVYASKPAYDDLRRCTLLREAPGDFPDLLATFGGTLELAPGKAYALWIEADCAGLPAGEYPVSAVVTGAGAPLRAAAVFKVGGTPLCGQTLVHTDWFHADCLATYYNVPVFGEAHWAVVERFMKNAADHGVNCILTPLFTPPLDTEVGAERPTVQLVGVTQTPGGWAFDFTLLEKWMALAERCGIRYFEFSHLFTQWGALAAPKVIAETPEGVKRVFGWETDSLSPAYFGFLRALGAALTAFTDARGVTDRCFVHCSDEPSKDHLARYEKCAALVHEAFGAFRHIDALSDLAYYENGLVPVPVPGENHIAPFVGKAVPLWTYYCCGQLDDEMPNRFIAIPSVRNRILGTLLYVYRCEGFLHWGYNFYYSVLSRKPIDPFTETSSDCGFPAGDAFCVYPGEDGVPMPSLRQKVFFHGLQDLRALQTAEKTLGRRRVERIVAETLGEIDFAHYPMDEDAFFKFRNALWEAVEREAPECDYTVRPLRDAEIPAALDLAWRVFSEYESPAYPPEGTAEFYKSIHDKAYLAGIRYYGAFCGGRLTGVLGVRHAQRHICFYFVESAHQRKGVGTALFRYLLAEFPGGGITLNAAPFGLPFYKALGFKPAGEERTVNGIRFTPMVYERL